MTKIKYFEENQTVYHYEYGIGTVYKIDEDDYYPIKVKFPPCTQISFTYDGRQYTNEDITLSQHPIQIVKIVNKPLEDEYIPFTFEDDLLSKYIEHKKDRRKGIVTYQGHAGVYTGDTFISYKDLLNHWQFIDKKTCGKLQK